MKKHLITALLYTAITTVALGIVYPLFVTVIAQTLFHEKANGQLLHDDKGQLVGSKLIGQPFTGPTYFHSRPSAAGTGYDAANSSGSNLGPTSKALQDRVAVSVAAESVANAPVPADLVTASASGLDPDITPAAALYQIPRIAPLRHFTDAQLITLVQQHTTPRQFGFLGEPRVNVLELNLALDTTK